MDQVRIARFIDLQEAQIAAGLLGSQGFSVHLQNEQLGAVDYLIRQAIGGFGLWVPEDEAEEAKILLAEAAEQAAEVERDPELAALPKPLTVRIFGWAFYATSGLVILAVIWSVGRSLMGVE